MSTTQLRTRQREYVPSPDEIRRATARIRRQWTPETRAARRRMARSYQQALLFNSSRSAA